MERVVSNRYEAVVTVLSLQIEFHPKKPINLSMNFLETNNVILQLTKLEKKDISKGSDTETEFRQCLPFFHLNETIE